MEVVLNVLLICVLTGLLVVSFVIVELAREGAKQSETVNSLKKQPTFHEVAT